MIADNLVAIGEKIQQLSVEVYGARRNGGTMLESEFELLDALDDLRAELVGPMRWPGTSFAPPDMAALQVAFQRRLFQAVPRALPDAENSNGASNGKAALSITAADLAVAASIPEDILVRIMRVLASNKMFEEVEEKVFAHTPTSAGLADDYVSASLAGIFNDVLKASTSLNDAIDSGTKTAWESRFGMSLYEYLERTPTAERERMAKSMVMKSKEEIEELSVAFPWHSFSRVVDVGGGFGHLVASLCKHHRHIRGVNQDLPKVIADAKKRVNFLSDDEKSIYQHIEFEVHDYYNPQPRTNCDAFILRRCLHNNSDANCIRILNAMVPGIINGGVGARLLIVEKLLPAWNKYPFRNQTKMLRREDLVMMISCGGKERTLEGFEALAKAADPRFEIDEVYHLNNHFGVVSIKLIT